MPQRNPQAEGKECEKNRLWKMFFNRILQPLAVVHVPCTLIYSFPRLENVKDERECDITVLIIGV